MKKQVKRLSAKKAAPKKLKKAPVRRLVLKAAPAEAMTADEVSHLETLVKRFEDSEKAWQRMTAERRFTCFFMRILRSEPLE